MTAAADPTKLKRIVAKPVEIREMEIGDLADVYELGEELFTAERWPSLYRTWDQYELATHFAADSETCLVAEDNDKVVGFIVGSVLEKPGSAWTYGYVIWLGVAPDTGRKGIGGKLVKRVQEIFIELGARMVLADTDADNAPAIGFFKHLGFGVDSEHVYLSKNLTYDQKYIEFHRAGRVAERRRRAARVIARKGKNG